MMHEMNYPAVGDRVKVVPGHEHMAGHAVGTIRQVIGEALGIEFDAAPGEIHQWYVASEVIVTKPAMAKEPMPAEPEEPMDMKSRAGSIGHVMSAFYSTPLAILPEKLSEILSFLCARSKGEHDADRGELLAKNRQSRMEALYATVLAIEPKAVRRSDGVVLAGRVAVMPVFGVLSQRVGAMERSSGGISTEEIGATLDSLVNDKQVRTVAMVYDSPGGSVFGIKELGEKIRAARDQKKIIGMGDPIAASAAFWLMAQSSESWVSPTGQVGSVGVIAAHDDISGMQEKMGVKTTLITSSPHKAEMNPYAPLSEDARNDLQSKVNYYHGQFIEALAKGRGITENRVEKSFGGGRMMTAEDAKAAGLVDRIGSLSDVLRRLGAEGPSAEDNTPAIVAEQTGPPLAARLAATRARALEVSQR